MEGASDPEQETRGDDAEQEASVEEASPVMGRMREPISEDDPGRRTPAAVAGLSPPEMKSTISTESTSSPFSGGDDADFEALGLGQPQNQLQQTALAAPEHLPPPPKPTLGNLHKRRASASPEKFNTGGFEPLPLRIDTSAATLDGPPRKKARIENKVEVSYDSLGTPRIASITPTCALASGKPMPTSAAFFKQQGTPADASSVSRQPFSILSALYRHNDLLLLLVSYLTIPSLISLYAISKPFHYLFNSNYMAFIFSNMRTWAPNADIIYPWRCYKPLCVRDPSLRKKSSMVGKHLQHQYQDLREVPSLQWLQMVVWRQGVCKDMLIQLATKGLRCPPGTLDSLRRMWFVLDLPLNSQRIALCRSSEYLTNQTLFFSTFFFLKIDMAFTDPAGPIWKAGGQHANTAAFPRAWERCGTAGSDLRELLMGERNFTPLWRVLRGWSPEASMGTLPMHRLDVLRLWVRHRFRLPETAPEHVKRQSILGVPWHEVGLASYERTSSTLITLPGGKTATVTHPALTSEATHQTHLQQQALYPHAKYFVVPSLKLREKLLRPEELVMRECVRRKLSMHKQWARMMLWGFCDELGRPIKNRSEEELLAWSAGKIPQDVLEMSARRRGVVHGRDGVTGGSAAKVASENDGRNSDSGEGTGADELKAGLPAPL